MADEGWAKKEIDKMARESDRPIRSLMPVPDLPTCPHCGSKHVKTFSRAARINEWLNEWKADATAALSALDGEEGEA